MSKTSIPLKTIYEFTKSLGLEQEATSIYYSITSAIHNESIEEEIREYEFNEIDLDQSDQLVLFADIFSNNFTTVFHGVLAHVLNKRNVASLFLFGDGCLDACVQKSNGSSIECIRCEKRSRDIAVHMNLPSIYLSEIDTAPIDVETPPKTDLYADSSSRMHFKIGELSSENEEHSQVIEDYKQSATDTWRALKAVDAEYDFDSVVTTGSPYLPRAMAHVYAREAGKHLTVHGMPAYGKGNQYLFGRMDGPLTQYMPDEAWEMIKSRPLTDKKRKELNDLMTERFAGHEYTELAGEESEPIPTTETELVSLFTHLPWDAGLFSRSRVFKNQYQWAAETIEEFREKKPRLIVKVHPAEEIHGTNQGMIEMIQERTESIPENVTLLPGSTDVGPYELLDRSDAALVYTSTIGMEAAYKEVPVITAADGHYAVKDFTYDPADKEEYFDLLGRIDELEFTPEMEELSKKYLHNYFVERPVGFNFITVEGKSGTDIEIRDDLFSDHDGLNDVADAILSDSHYYYTKST